MIVPSRAEWSAISLSIAKELEKFRSLWFDSCVRTLDRAADKESFYKPVVISQLGGKADIAIKAYQLYGVSDFLGGHGYIPASDGQDFADLLCGQVCGTQPEQVLDYFFTLHTLYESDPSKEMDMFASDVAKYITGTEAGGAFVETALIKVHVKQAIARAGR